ncbi:MAG: hypothetical protein HY815_17990 [Candidatus Riflebacteria bacterium]|nr:hypothetical protein [Candidatus Riflebacteria bacterium]
MIRSDTMLAVGVLALVLCTGAIAQVGQTDADQSKASQPYGEPAKSEGSGEAAKTGSTDQSASTPQFHANIDRWCRGEITDVDVNQKVITLRGTEMSFATETSKMLREIHGATQDISDAAKKKEKEDSIRQEWKARLDKAAAASAGEASELRVHVPGSGTMSILEESEIAGVDFLRRELDTARAPGAAPGSGTLGAPVVGGPEKPSGGYTLADLKVGDQVLVGYDSGVFSNDAYVVVRLAAKPAPQKK